MERLRVDLHVHTSISDGGLSPCEVVRKAEAAGLDVISLTDHDTFLAYRDDLGGTRVRVIAGFELSSVHAAREYHVLGYFTSLPAGSFLRYVEGIETERRERMCEGFRRMAAAGMDLDFGHFLSLQTSRLLTSAHIARYMLDQGLVDSEEKAFDIYIRRDSSVVPPPATPMRTAIEMINGAGGISVWAHPPVVEFDCMIEMAVEAGLQGIEVVNFWRPHVDPTPFISAAQKYSLLATGGSDYHTDDHPCPLGSHYVTEDTVSAFLNRF
ncbi:MAG: PHP domain-containing protein [Acidobacteriota bacterium]